MSSFPERARQAEDSELPVRQRWLALRDCVTHFSVYGHQATWRHVITWAGIPRRLEDDLDSLGRAVAELRAAREIWLPVVAEFAARRGVEKARGQRQPAGRDRWLGRRIEAYCPYPDLRPSGPMAGLVARLVAGYRDGSVWGRDCVVCGATRDVVRVCPGCGVFVLGVGEWRYGRGASG